MTAITESVLDMHSPFAQDLVQGLSAPSKTLPCKWFYDERGSHLFEDITRTPEYYPTRVETQLLHALVPQLADLIPDLQVVIEPGSGASVKTRILLSALPGLRTYIPLDISEEFLLQAAAQLQRDFPSLQVSPMVHDFTAAMAPLALPTRQQRLVFFPGSTIGNFSPGEAHQLLRNMRLWAGEHAWLLIGVDMTQHVPTLLAAYNDAAGVTAEFNRNLLLRANRELDADFDLNSFQHRALFNAQQGRVEMHLVSTRQQQVMVNDHRFHFSQGESIHTENCYKYTRNAFGSMATECGWHVRSLWQDQPRRNEGEGQQQTGFGVFLLQS